MRLLPIGLMIPPDVGSKIAVRKREGLWWACLPLWWYGYATWDEAIWRALDEAGLGR